MHDTLIGCGFGIYAVRIAAYVHAYVLFIVGLCTN